MKKYLRYPKKIRNFADCAPSSSKGWRGPKIKTQIHNMELQGKIIQELPLLEGVSKAGKPWKKKEWVLETMGAYPRKVKFDFFGDRADANPLVVGQNYIITIDIESREFNGRWYTDVHGLSARPDAAVGGGQFGGSYTQAPAQDPFGMSAPAAAAAPSFPEPDSSDDLPF